MAGGELAPRARRVLPGEQGGELVEWEFQRVPDRLWLDLLAGAGLPPDLRVQVNGRRLRVQVDRRDRAEAVAAMERAVTEATKAYESTRGPGSPPEVRGETEADPAGRDLYEADLAQVVGRRHLRVDSPD